MRQSFLTLRAKPDVASTIWLMLQLFRYSRTACASILTCAPLLFAQRPQTSLRVLCVAAFEYLARLQGRSLPRKDRIALAYACDFGALRNDFYDQYYLDPGLYRELRRSLRYLAPETATRRYIRELREVERGRPVFGPEGFPDGAVDEYRMRVLVLSLEWLQIISRRSLEPRLFPALVALVALLQLVDDLIDWKDDWACRRPTYVTALLRDSTRPSRESMLDIHVQANHFRLLLVSASAQDLRAIPLTLAGCVVWLLAVALIRVRFSR